jgi:O-methyltransferase domain
MSHPPQHLRYTPSMENAANDVIELTMSYAVPRCLHVIAELGVADALDDTSRTAAELAMKTDADADALARALRLLSAYGVFEMKDGRFAHTPTSRLLRSDHPQSMRSFVRMIGNPAVGGWKAFELLEHSMRTGEASSSQAVPGGMWKYMSEHPEESRIFDEAMTGKSQAIIPGVLEACDFSRFKTIADIGGGRGHLLRAILGRAPKATGVVFDLPHVVEDAARQATPRLEFQAGDFFKDKLPVCDAYIIMQVIHDWNDAKATDILRAVRKSAPANAKLLLVEAIVPNDSKPSWIKMLDIFMLAILNGKERTLAEFEALFAASNFRRDKLADAGLGMSVLEATAV